MKLWAGLGCLALLLLTGCGSSRPPAGWDSSMRVHTVRKGETLWAISQRYGTTVEAVAVANRLSNPRQIRVGQRLVVPNGRARLRSDESWTRSHPRGRSASTQLTWPVRGQITSSFGRRNGAHHDGIDISVKKGTKVRAAESGRVVHSDDRLSGYGNLIIVKHSGSLSSVYAHNRRNLVKVGEFVERGDVIAESGDTGRASAPHLHFEIRRNGRAENPLDYLE